MHLYLCRFLTIDIQAKLLHGEQYLSVKKAIPTSGTLTNHVKLLEVLDKGKAAAVTVQVETKDSNGDVVFENQSTVFLRGCGGIGGRKTGKGQIQPLPLLLYECS